MLQEEKASPSFSSKRFSGKLVEKNFFCEAYLSNNSHSFCAFIARVVSLEETQLIRIFNEPCVTPQSSPSQKPPRKLSVRFNTEAITDLSSRKDGWTLAREAREFLMDLFHEKLELKSWASDYIQTLFEYCPQIKDSVGVLFLNFIHEHQWNELMGFALRNNFFILWEMFDDANDLSKSLKKLQRADGFDFILILRVMRHFEALGDNKASSNQLSLFEKVVLRHNRELEELMGDLSRAKDRIVLQMRDHSREYSDLQCREFFIGGRVRVSLSLCFLVGIVALCGFVGGKACAANDSCDPYEAESYIAGVVFGAGFDGLIYLLSRHLFRSYGEQHGFIVVRETRHPKFEALDSQIQKKCEMFMGGRIPGERFVSSQLKRMESLLECYKKEVVEKLPILKSQSRQLGQAWQSSFFDSAVSGGAMDYEFYPAGSLPGQCFSP